ncbi:hypothetical protein RTBOTA2_002588 [Rhodotorula toruloides]|nr:hypothetical protein RTBOTA2_002588 [Rhodotorula toruloides]
MGKNKGKAAAKATADTTEATPAPATGLSSFLLGQASGKDADLDDIFAHSKGPSVAFQPKEQKEVVASTSAAAAVEDDEASADDEEAVENDADLSELESGAELSDEADEEEGDDLEEAYAARLAAAAIKKKQSSEEKRGTKRKAEDEGDEEASDDEEEEQSEADEDEDEDAVDINDLIQDSLKDVEAPSPSKTRKGKEPAKKSAKLEKRAQETPEDRDARTVFLGNVPADCSTSRPLKKALVRHVLQHPSLASTLPAGCPPLKLDSIRFRSIAFASKVFGRKVQTGEQNGGDHSRKRARAWRESEGSDLRGVKGGFRATEEEPAPVASKSQPLTDAQKRKVALIRGELNEGKKACNAYLVIAALPENVDPRAVVSAVIQAVNNSVFEGFTVHADAVRPRSAAALLAAAQLAAKPNANLTEVPKNNDAYQVPATDAKRTVFIGGLDFAESEENVRKAVEAVLVRERGEPDGRSYVENVRVVRDPSSGLGKGFCYVLLQDESCVDELLALPPGKLLKISKRKVRLERCKTAAAAARAKVSARTAASVPARVAASTASSKSGPKPVRLAAPRDPTLPRFGKTGGAPSEHKEKLAEALAELPADERKKIKSMDAERIARRAAKKEQKRLAARYERKQANAAKKGGGEGILGRESRVAERHRKEKKRIAKQSKNSLKKK